MRLTDYTDYSIRVLMYLGVNRDKLVTIQEIADAYGISKSHLMKVVHQLGLSGLVETVRGRNGGMRLGMEPADINIGELVRHTEPDFAMVECFGRHDNDCILTPSCKLQHALSLATQAYLDTLNQFTLADLLRGSGSLHKLVQVQVVRREKLVVS